MKVDSSSIQEIYNDFKCYYKLRDEPKSLQSKNSIPRARNYEPFGSTA